MVPKKQRVTKELFDRVFNKGKVHTAEHVYVRALSDTTLSHPHYAVVVPKKIEKSAVARNKLKRKGYAVLKKTKLPPGVFLFFLKKGADTVSFEGLSREITELIHDINHI